ncbi:hypothetical protein ACFL0R_02490 [Pseudomonadota bacterium]
MSEPLLCWKCGASIEELPQPLGRYDICLSCRAELYVCRMCEFFDPLIAQGCHEPMADVVKEKERANFCNYFQLRPNAFQPTETGTTDKAHTELDALFGNTPAEDATTPSGEDTSNPPENNHARDQLERLFKPSGNNED